MNPRVLMTKIFPAGAILGTLLGAGVLIGCGGAGSPNGLGAGGATVGLVGPGQAGGEQGSGEGAGNEAAMEAAMSSPINPLDQPWNGVLGGLAVAARYDAATRSVQATVQNTLSQVQCYVQAEPHLKLGTRTVGELGPDVLGHLSPGQQDRSTWMWTANSCQPSLTDSSTRSSRSHWRPIDGRPRRSAGRLVVQAHHGDMADCA